MALPHIDPDRDWAWIDEAWIDEKPRETRTIHSVTIPGHGLFRAYDDDVESIRGRTRRDMLETANEIATPVDFSDVSTSALVIILASFTPGSSAL